jgi:beta-phosphoglucomutase-like phosphatase (HAD superfamily)
VLEDSPAGVLAGKAASMTVVAVPADSERSRPEIALADVVLDSLIELDAGLLAKLSGGMGTHPLG